MGRLPITALLVAAHPDDEVVGAGIWLHRHRDAHVHILHITDGSPRDMQDARRLGFDTREQYANARRKELREALALAGVSGERCIRLDYPDKDAYLHLPAIISRISTVVESLRPQLILSPPYEGGHPDHDAAAFAVATVTAQRSPLVHREYPLYHANADGQMVTGTFLPREAAPQEDVITFTPEERVLKRRMIACFGTQQHILSCFGIDCERFRQAPVYDFTAAPHRGPLLYETWNWSISGGRWRREAMRFLAG